METNILIIALVSGLFTILSCFYCIDHIEAQEYYKNISLSRNFADVENSLVGIKIKYPENWTVQYIKGNNNSLATSAEVFDEFLKDTNNVKWFEENYPTVSDKYQYYLDYINSDCGIVMDCREIGNTYLQSYIRDSSKLNPTMSIFDYVPSLSFLPPVENLTDNFLDNVKITSFILPFNSTLIEFVDYVINNLGYHPYPITLTDYDCQSYILGYTGCKITYTFTIGDNNKQNNIEKIEYVTSQYFIEENNKIYLISYNTLAESYSRHIELVNAMLESLEFL